jgi:2-polyprenyl-6-methoxyphenol hydroxylase-like FAD-dependent oxidoreductase
MTETVVIAGGGAAGLLLACELGLAGVPVTVVERGPGPRDRSGGMLLHSRVEEALRIRGLADRVRDATTPRWPRTHFALLWLDLGDIGRTDYDLIVPQWRTERMLAERAAEVGADIRYGHEVVGVEQDADSVAVTVRSTTGTSRLTGAYLVGADGPRSRVADLAGFTFEEFAPSYYGVIADVPVPDGDVDHFHAGAYPYGQFGALPVNPADPTEIRLMTVEFFRDPPADDVPVTVDELRAGIRRITDTDPPVPTPHWITRYGSPTRLATNYRNGRVFLAGDAAHPHPPSAGNGLNTAVHDALNLGWKLAGRVHGWAPSNLLDTYHEERHPIGRKACVRAIAQVPLQYPPDHVGPLRELFAELMKIKEVNDTLVRMVTHARYPTEVADDPESTGDPLLGEVLPDLPLTSGSGEHSALDLLHGGRGLALDLSGGNRLPDLSRWKDRVDAVSARSDTDLAGSWLLVRPDGHVAWVDRSGTRSDALLTAVRTWFG